MRSQYQPAYYQPAQLGVLAARLEEIDFHKQLLGKANQYLKDGQNETAVVFAQAACEMCTEYVLTLLFQVRGVPFLSEPVLDLFQVRSIFNKGLRKIYTALSRDSVQHTPFWQKLRHHYKRRNKIVHKGARCTKREAEESIRAVGQYIRHVDRVIEKIRLQQKGR